MTEREHDDLDDLDDLIAEFAETFCTMTGRVLTDADLDALAAEAERGYDTTRIKENIMTDTTNVLEGAAPYDPAEDEDRAALEALRRMGEGLRNAAACLVHTNAQAAHWLDYAADGATTITDIVGADADDRTEEG